MNNKASARKRDDLEQEMPLNACIQSGDNPDLTEERQKCSFDTEKIAELVWGGRKELQRRREIREAVAKVPSLADSKPRAFMTRNELVEDALRKEFVLTDLAPKLIDTNDRDASLLLREFVHGIDGQPLAIHYLMFIPGLYNQADDEQKAEWLERAARCEIIGTYSQTELGHGTNLRQLETTATYNKATQEFILHSPTVTSTKWWPGNLGKIVNHTVVVAQLIIDSKSYGPHNFIVPVRDINTHMPLKGITLGDIGPKMGIHTVDNGFLRMDNVRIPRRNMLMRHAQVTADGRYIRPAHAALAYGAMVFMRSTICSAMGRLLGMALTISIRYSCSLMPFRKGEVKVLDYQTQQYRLLPNLGRAYAMIFAGAEVRRMYNEFTKESLSGNLNVSDLNEGRISQADTLADLHALTSGLKSVSSFEAELGIDQCRQACGGHGYSLAARISDILNVAVAACTYEGENMVMLQQVARYLVRMAQQVSSEGKSASPLTEYLARKGHFQCTLAEGVTASGLLEALEHAARHRVFKAAERLQRSQASSPAHVAWNENTVELNRAARAHTRYFIATSFYNVVHQIEDASARTAMEDLVLLYLAYEVVNTFQYLLEAGYLTGPILDKVKDKLYEQLGRVRPNAVSLVDAFDFSDGELLSVLGRRDGHVYENLLKWAQESPLNETEVLPSFHKYMKPLTKKLNEQSKL